MSSPVPKVLASVWRLVRRAVQLVLLGMVHGYRWLISPLLPPACRFYPTCSAYALEALRRHGPVTGSVLTVRRLCRCHPLHEGGIDLVP